MTNKYTPFEQYLRDLPKNQKEATLTFEHIEGILKSKLPASAYEDHRWWLHETGGHHRNTRAWTNAGWKVESVDFNRKQAKLVRV